MFQRYKKLPVFNWAVQWDGSQEMAQSICNVMYGKQDKFPSAFELVGKRINDDFCVIKIKTKSGWAICKKGDYIIKEMDGPSFPVEQIEGGIVYPCSEKIFENSYSYAGENE